MACRLDLKPLLYQRLGISWAISLRERFREEKRGAQGNEQGEPVAVLFSLLTEQHTPRLWRFDVRTNA
jgi:hypothetical protein